MDEPLAFPPIQIQVTPIEEAVERDGRAMRGPRDVIRQISEAQMRQAFGAAEGLAQQTAEMLLRLQARPEHRQLAAVELEFGLAFNTELKVYVVGAKADASLRIKLTWSAPNQE